MAEYTAYNGVATAGLVTGITGAIAFLNQASNGNGILGLGGTNKNVTKDELNYVQQLGDKNMEIAILKSEQNTEIKIADVYERLITRINADKAEQTAWNASQSVINAQVSAAVATNNNSIVAIQNILNCLTKTVIPADNVCPKPMPQFNSWTAPTT